MPEITKVRFPISFTLVHGLLTLYVG